jgi:excisionase family DNA binding protein
MTSMAEQMTSAEVARQLGIGVRQVERLVASGELAGVGVVGRALLVDAVSVQRLRDRGVAKGRPWSAETVRAAIDLLRTGQTERLERSQRSRLRAKLRTMTARDLVRAVRRRADVTRYRASASFIAELRDRVLLTGAAAADADRKTAAALGLVMARRDMVDGYVDGATAARLIGDYFLAEDVQGNVALRVVDTMFAEGARVADIVTVALDLAESLDARERSASLGFLEQTLAELR